MNECNYLEIHKTKLIEKIKIRLDKRYEIKMISIKRLIKRNYAVKN